MKNQVKTIDVDQMWMRGKRGVCSEYVLYSKIRRKYINHIEENITSISKELINQKQFTANVYFNKLKIHYIIDSIDKFFTLDNLEEILSKELSTIDFIHEVYAIRKRNIEQSPKRSRVKSQT